MSLFWGRLDNWLKSMSLLHKSLKEGLTKSRSHPPWLALPVSLPGWLEEPERQQRCRGEVFPAW